MKGHTPAPDRSVTTLSCDVIVAGAGPAGSVLAALLAGWGRDVVLLHRPGPLSGVEEETLVPSASGLLARLSLLDLVRERSFFGTPRAARVWGKDAIEWREGGDEERGFKVERATFDRELREMARQRGVRVIEGASALAPLEAGDVRIALADGNEAMYRTCVAVAACGRNMSDSLASAEIEEELPAMLAFTARITRPREAADATVIEAVSEGWLWWLPLSNGSVAVTLFADRDEVKERGQEEVWQSALHAAIGPARSCDAPPERGTLASPRLRTSSSRVLLAGDAASSIDPLSSQGLEKALASAEHCALCANTLLEGRVDAALVFAHQRAWERRLYRAHKSDTLAFYRREQRFSGAPFWRARHAIRDERLDVARSPLPSRLRPHPEIESAPALVRRGSSLEEVRGWRRAGSDEAIAQVGALSVGALLESCTPRATLEEALARAARHPELCALSPRIVAQALAELVERGLIVGLP